MSSHRWGTVPHHTFREGALFAAANLGAATLLFTSEPVGAVASPASLPDTFLLAAPLAEAELRTRETIEVQVREPSPAPASTPEPEPRSETATDAAARAGTGTPAQAETEIEAGDVPVTTEPVSARRRRPRGPAATRTLTGVRLPPRARRTSAREARAT